MSTDPRSAIMRVLLLVLSVGLLAVLPIAVPVQAQPTSPRSPAVRSSTEPLPSIGVHVARLAERAGSAGLGTGGAVRPPTETRRDRIVLGTAFLVGSTAALTGGVLGGVGAVHLFQDGNELSTSLGLVLSGGALALGGTGVWMAVQGIRILRGKPQPLPPGYDRRPHFETPHVPSGMPVGGFAVRF